MAVDRVTLVIEGLMIERLINRITGEGVRMHLIERIDRRQIRMQVSSVGARAVCALCEKYRISCRTEAVEGLRAISMWIRQRFTVIAAAAVMLALCSFYLSRIWVVDIKLLRGDSLPAETESTLAEAGIIEGAGISGMDTTSAELMLGALEGCAHASVSRKGVFINVEIACEEAAPELFSISGSEDLIALRDGIVTSVNVKSGTAMVAPGDTVRRGQVLISGYERTSGENVRDVTALGSVRARSWVMGEAEESASVQVQHYTGRRSFNVSLVTPWKEYVLTDGEHYENCDMTVMREPLAGLFIPVYIEKTDSAEYLISHENADTEAVKTRLEAVSAEKAYQKMPKNAEIIDKWTDFSMIESEDIIHARTVVEIETEIAVTRGYMEEDQVE